MSKSPENHVRVKHIQSCLEECFSPIKLFITDESHKHVGHAGAQSGKGHFSITIVSENFEGLTPIHRHQKIYQALGSLLQTDIHALSITAKTPNEYKSN